MSFPDEVVRVIYVITVANLTHIVKVYGDWFAALDKT